MTNREHAEQLMAMLTLQHASVTALANMHSELWRCEEAMGLL